jgi:hypothetical protein
MITRIVTVTDLRRAGHCARGIKNWFEVQGLDFKDFLKNGIPAEKLYATGDGQVLAALKQIEKRDAARGEKG